jgi:hypothetical protein
MTWLLMAEQQLSQDSVEMMCDRLDDASRSPQLHDGKLLVDRHNRLKQPTRSNRATRPPNASQFGS